MKIVTKAFDGLIVFEPQKYEDERGIFYERFNLRDFLHLSNTSYQFVQDNQSRSKKYVLRGLHYQHRFPQGKLISVIKGEVLDVSVDLRSSSSYFGKHFSIKLSEDNRYTLWIPPGYAHGFQALSDNTEVIYKTTDYWKREDEHTLLWQDQILNIEWPYPKLAIVSTKDSLGKLLSECAVYP